MDRLPRTNKGRNKDRWLGGRELQTQVIPTLPSSGHAAVLWACWFNAEYHQSDLVFDLTASQIAPIARVSVGHANVSSKTLPGMKSWPPGRMG